MADLSERDFFSNQSLSFFPFLFFFLALSLIVFFSLLLSPQEKEKEAFSSVTNREFSLFLWDFPVFLRSHAAKKMGYLPDFFTDRPNFDPEAGENLIKASPDILFLYHTWKRLLFNQITPPLIEESNPAFLQFQKEMPEWFPPYWKGSLNDISIRKAFVGWQNYFKNGEAINTTQVTVRQLKDFLELHPHYGRSFWRNLERAGGKRIVGKEYLFILEEPLLEESTVVPSEQMSSFLKVALYHQTT